MTLPHVCHILIAREPGHISWKVNLGHIAYFVHMVCHIAGYSSIWNNKVNVDASSGRRPNIDRYLVDGILNLSLEIGNENNLFSCTNVLFYSKQYQFES